MVIAGAILLAPSVGHAETLLESHFDANEEGFAYADDTFEGTNEPGYAAGSYEGAGGQAGGGLRVFLGPGSVPGDETSGGWSKNFNVAAGGKRVTIGISYRLVFASNYEANEFGEAVMEIDGGRVGSDTNNSLVRLVGNGQGGPDMDSGWLSDEFQVVLAGGAHTITVGA